MNNESPYINTILDTPPQTQNTALNADYEFLGWSLEDNNTPDPDALKNITSDRILYACWQKIQKHVDPDTGEILDSWAEINEAMGNGTYKEIYSIGNWKNVSFGDTYGTAVPMEIVAFDVDEYIANEGVSSYSNVSVSENTNEKIQPLALPSVKYYDFRLYVEGVLWKTLEQLAFLTTPTIDSIYGFGFDAPNSNKSGYKFIGWSTEDNNIPDSNDKELVAVNSVITVYACFAEVKLAPITWIAKDCLKGTYQWNSTTTNAGGYEKSLIRQTVENDIYSALEGDVKPYITSVEKTFSLGKDDGDKAGTTSSCISQLWIPSAYEISDLNKAIDKDNKFREDDGVNYLYCAQNEIVEKNGEVRYWLRKVTVDTDTSATWWLRSASSIMPTIVVVQPSGKLVNFNSLGQSKSNYSIAPGFCTAYNPNF